MRYVLPKTIIFLSKPFFYMLRVHTIYRAANRYDKFVIVTIFRVHYGYYVHMVIITNSEGSQVIFIFLIGKQGLHLLMVQASPGRLLLIHDLTSSQLSHFKCYIQHGLNTQKSTICMGSISVCLPSIA